MFHDFITVCISWNNKKCLDTIDAWCKHEDYRLFVGCILIDIIKRKLTSFLTNLWVWAFPINTAISSNQTTDKLTTVHSWNKQRESVAFHIERKSKLREYESWKNTNKRSDGSDTVLKQGKWKTKLKLNLIQGHS